jgi:hypothetical protein
VIEVDTSARRRQEPRKQGRIIRRIARELGTHAPYTAVGAVGGIAVMLAVVLSSAPKGVSEALFYTLHPLHIVMSALATTSMYRRGGRGRLWVALVVGYTGAIGIATLSDAVMPFLGGSLLGADMHFHLPFVDADPMPMLRLPTWIVVNASAVAGIAIGLRWPATKIPHLGHVLLSTWASLFGLTAFGEANWLVLAPLVFVFLFLAVWLPCCVSDVIYPLLWAKEAHDVA